MNAVVDSVPDVQTSEYEDAAFKEMFPWRCYRNGMKTSHDFKTVVDVSNATGIVFAITGYLSLAILQLVTHFIIDYAKAVQKTYSARASFLIDQFLHVAVLGITAGFFVSMTPYSVR